MKRQVKQAANHDGIGWYRLESELNVPEDWTIPLKLCMKAEIDAII